MGNENLVEVLFAPGKKLLIEFIDDEKKLKSYQATVEDLEGAYLVLQAPVVNGVPVPFRESQELTLRRLDSEAEEVYVTNVFVIDVRQGKVPLLVCSKPKKFDRSSLRRFSRFDVNLPVTYKSPQREAELSGTINDLSLSGCYLLIEPDPLVTEGDVLDLVIGMPADSSELNLKGRVIRVDNPAEEGTRLIGLAIDYVNLSEADRETLYYYIFQLQLTSDSILSPES